MPFCMCFFFNSKFKKKNWKKRKEKENIKGRSPSLESKQDKGPTQPPRNQLRQVMDSIEVFVFSSQ